MAGDLEPTLVRLVDRRAQFLAGGEVVELEAGRALIAQMSTIRRNSAGPCSRCSCSVQGCRPRCTAGDPDLRTGHDPSLDVALISMSVYGSMLPVVRMVVTPPPGRGAEKLVAIS